MSSRRSHEQFVSMVYDVDNKWTGISLLDCGNTELFNIDILGLDNDKN